MNEKLITRLILLSVAFLVFIFSVVSLKNLESLASIIYVPFILILGTVSAILMIFLAVKVSHDYSDRNKKSMDKNSYSGRRVSTKSGFAILGILLLVLAVYILYKF